MLLSVGQFDDAVKPHLKQTITENYSGMNSSDSTTQIWNGVMIKVGLTY